MRIFSATSDGAAAFGALISVVAGLFAMTFLGTFAIFVPLLLFPPLTSVKVGLLQVGLATTALYLVSNALQTLSKRRPGYHEDGASPLARRQLSQPVLIAISFALGVLLVAYPGWWHHRLASREYAHSRVCYAQLRAADRVPELQANFAPGYLQYEAALYLSIAEEHGAMLGTAKDAVDRDLSEAAASFSSSASAHERRGRSALLTGVTECLDDDWAAHGEIANP